MSTNHISLQRPGSDRYRDAVQESCIVPDCQWRSHDKVWRIKRPVRPWGHFVTAVINKRDPRGRFGSSEVIDGSLPHHVTQLPQDAVELTPAELARVWHEDNESHVFGGPNVAKALRESIAAHNEEVTRDHR